MPQMISNRFSPGACVLEPDTTYFFNLTLVRADGTSSCEILYGSRCTTTVQVVHRGG